MDLDLSTRVAQSPAPLGLRITPLSSAELAEIAEAWSGLPAEALVELSPPAHQVLLAAARQHRASSRLLDARVAAVWHRSVSTSATAKRALEVNLRDAHRRGWQLPTRQAGSTRDLMQLWDTDSAGVYRIFKALSDHRGTKKKTSPGPCFVVIHDRPTKGDQWRPWQWTSLDPLRVLNVLVSGDEPRLFPDEQAGVSSDASLRTTSLTAGVTTEVSLPTKTPSGASTSAAKKSDRASVDPGDGSAEERDLHAVADASAARDLLKLNLDLDRFEEALQELLQTKSASDFDATDQARLAGALRRDLPAVQDHFARKVVRGLREGKASSAGIVAAIAASKAAPEHGLQFAWFYGALRNQCPVLLGRVDGEGVDNERRPAAETGAAGGVTAAVSLPAKIPTGASKICAKARQPCYCCENREAAGSHGFCLRCVALGREGRNKFRRQLEAAGEVE